MGLHRRLEEDGPHVRPQINLEKSAAAGSSRVKHQLYPEYAILQAEGRHGLLDHSLTLRPYYRAEQGGKLPHRHPFIAAGVSVDGRFERTKRDADQRASAHDQLRKNLRSMQVGLEQQDGVPSGATAAEIRLKAESA
eukprot:CAMPEP_0181223178 /NCGR_PEP_ID=MMETSP1096-20121128/30368_1 /TAXON_ID=156174 ORGANISM="Chrysochromulina ericina, Strain CCMP281" /NCGR_SAMPLE_ID=MMETSP1096 /ASSEMBLY_ACC=CAM_ASM_000453 /LENGTH=136 /DNA_ID=CAMNT_0023316003 /DNA_START=389 /DNA_END=797 /DNA_ORIENTATION=-